MYFNKNKLFLQKSQLIAFLCGFFAITACVNSITVITPGQSEIINAPSVIVLGQSDPKHTLFINNKQVQVHPNGSFVTTVPVRPGMNKLWFEAGKETKEIIVYQPTPEYSFTARPLRISTINMVPGQEMEYLPGDIIKIAFRGSPGHKASAKIGSTHIPMQETLSYKNISKPVFCENQPIKAEQSTGVYQGTYAIQPTDHFQKTAIVVKLTSGNEEVSQTLPSTLTVLSDAFPIVAQTSTQNAVVRTAPDANRLTPLPQGVKIHITGKVGTYYRFQMGKNRDGWIESRFIELLPPGTSLPHSELYQVFLDQSTQNIIIKIPLKEKLPYILDQTDQSGLKLQLFGALINLDFVRYPTGNCAIDNITWNQSGPDTCEINIRPGFAALHGFEADYEGTTLVIKLRIPRTNTAKGILSGKTITIDPGHGGEAAGAIGPTGVKEKTVNLAIAAFLKSELEQLGAIVVMTRTTEDENPSFEQRVNAAKDAKSDVLISIHNNALPNGRDPYLEHGSSTYYYHLQALPLARAIQSSLLQDLGLIDYGVYWGNLVLARPTNPVAVLVEVGFMIHPEEYQKLIDPAFQKKSATAIRKGLENYFSSAQKK
ncbi:MAG TPA: hypothetical protein DCS13_11585 [Candidatus Margulisbacteria bacterium]|nr:MAG: hypothetical protein A2X43_10820 [Candidatus Margulisbacteria bacterium GWD2_39_127]HAR64096.1 hypothetical protein [Candidatus Margulisiibacteriota bacterium]